MRHPKTETHIDLVTEPLENIHAAVERCAGPAVAKFVTDHAGKLQELDKFKLVRLSPDQWTVEAREGYVLVPCGNGSTFRIAEKQ
jgi:hypothetical protein